MADTFTARLAPSFESQPKHERLYEIVTPEGERIASATNEAMVRALAKSLNGALQAWASAVGSDAVIAGEDQ